MTMRRGVRRRRHGGSFLSAIGSALSKAHNFIKSNKIISRTGNILGSLGVPYAGAIGKASSVLGYGRRRRVRRRRGGNLRSILTNAHKFIKDKRLISSALKHFAPSYTGLHKAASALGYGRRRTVRRRIVRRRRGGDLRSVLSSAHKFIKDKRLVSSALRHFMPNSNLHKAAHALGYGRRPVRQRAVRHYGGANFFSTEQIAVPRF
jgi:hypothetical protein